MKFNLINKESWDRLPYFNYYMNDIKCTFSITANIEITNLLMEIETNELKLYPILLYITSNIINKHKELRTSFDENGNLGYWESINPSFTIFHEDNKTFSNIWVEYLDDLRMFYTNCILEIKKYSNVKRLFAKKNQPQNIVPISCVPWFSFTGVNFNVCSYEKFPYLLPVITYGKYFKRNEEIFIPISLQIHHAVCDGYHATRFLNELQKMAWNFKTWLVLN
ncbi:type A chloramphenicol O-acetyltransferase [Clostridium rectalis]|uniref:type A chloramphenicol O-acetyltransferase n=1 Tax=Clostridium rectalis TaxID=2040295 RepID=UPI000F63B7EE|nr:type A chloramphenicol O-acetyltransferase [Clostridium rectalis]